MTLPIVFLVLDVYPLRRLGGEASMWFGRTSRGVRLEKILSLILPSGAAVTALLAQYRVGALEPIEGYSVLSRIAQVFFGLVFYLWKTVMPFGLSPLYEILPYLNPWEWHSLLSGILVVGISLSLFVLRNRWPAGLAVRVCYIAILAPVLGMAQSGPQLVADRYSYLLCLGWVLLVGAGVITFWRAWVDGRLKRLSFFVIAGVTGMILVGLWGLTWEQVQVWDDTGSLFRHVVSVTPESRTANYNLGILLEREGRLDEAVRHYREAVRIDPDDVEGRINLVMC